MDIITLSIPIFTLLLGVELLVDRLMKTGRYRLNDATTNISCGIFDQVVQVFSAVVTVGFYMLFYNMRLFDFSESWWGYVLAFLLIDLAYYWAHRKSHEINLFWAGHVVHHSSEEYNLSVALRQSVMQKFFTLWAYIPIALLGISPEVFVTCFAINLLYQFWIHTEFIGKLWQPIEWLLNTPSNHRVHHGRNPKYIDRNHAGVLMIWDRIFGTFQAEEEAPIYGITVPLNNWNPLYAQFHYFGNIAHDLGRVDGFTNKLALLFRKPGWLPKEDGGTRLPPEVDASTPPKFHNTLPQKLNVYILVQYAILVGASSAFLFQVKTMENTAYQLLIAVFLLGGITIIGDILNEKARSKWLEIGRLILSAIIGVLALGGVAGVVVGVLLGLSIVWFLRIK